MDFEVLIKPSFEEYKTFSRTVADVVHHRRRRLAVLLAVMLLVAGLLVYLGEIWIACTLCAVWAAAILFGRWRGQRNLQKAWQSNALLRESETRLRFTDGGIDVTTQNGTAHLDYDKLYRLIETKTHFYLLSATNAGTGVAKSLCTPEQQDFIRGKCTAKPAENDLRP